VTLLRKGEVVNWVHAWLYLDLLVYNCDAGGFAIQSHCLFLVTDCFHAAVVEFFQRAGQQHLDGRHGWQLRLVLASESRPKQTAFNFSASFVANVKEGVVAQKERVKNLE
jgi:hypothetical protein